MVSGQISVVNNLSPHKFTIYNSTLKTLRSPTERKQTQHSSILADYGTLLSLTTSNNISWNYRYKEHIFPKVAQLLGKGKRCRTVG